MSVAINAQSPERIDLSTIDSDADDAPSPEIVDLSAIDSDADDAPSPEIVDLSAIDSDADDAELAEMLQLQEVLLYTGGKLALEEKKPARTLTRASKESAFSRGSSRKNSRRRAPAHDHSAAVDSIVVSDEEQDATGPIKRYRTVTEVVESSSSARRNAPEFYCIICMEKKPRSERFTIPICLHRFCSGCVGNYIAAKVEENLTSIKCPDPECKDGSLEPEVCKEILTHAVYDRWGLALCESAFAAKKFYCPFEDCSALLMDDSGDGQGEMITQAECPHCHRLFCALCKVSWHDAISCQDFQKLGKDERGKDDILVRNLAATKSWQRCPNCKMYVEKRDGCMLITCRCGYCFCYVCADPMSKLTHYCVKCRR